MFLIIGLSLLAVSVLLMLLTVVQVFKSTRFRDKACEAEGAVVEMAEHLSAGDVPGPYYHPVVEFETREGRRVTFESSTGSNWPSYRVGQLVRVVYDPDDPRQAKLNTAFAVWGVAL